MSIKDSPDKFYVYEHWRPDEGVIFYVGKGHARRAYDWHRGRNRWHKFIVAKLRAAGLKVEVRIVHRSMLEVDALAKERELIAHWRSLGADLVNLTDGGDGPSGRKHSEEWKTANSARMKGRKWSDESRAKMSESMKGNTNSLGKKKPQDVIDRIAAANRGKKRTPELKAHLSAIRKANPTFLGRHHTPEAIEKIKAKQIGVPKPESVKLNMRGKPKSDEHKKKLSEVNLGKTHSEETRAKISAISKADWARRKAIQSSDVANMQLNFIIDVEEKTKGNQ